MYKLLLGLVIVVSTNADVIVSPTVTGDGSAGFSYDYVVQNVDDDPIFEISFLASGFITGVTEPTGWFSATIPFGDETVVTWVSSDVPFDVVAGESLSGFSLMSSDLPGTVIFSATTESFALDTAASVGPTTTSEPATQLVVALGLVVLYRRFRLRSAGVVGATQNSRRLC